MNQFFKKMFKCQGKNNNSKYRAYIPFLLMKLIGILVILVSILGCSTGKDTENLSAPEVEGEASVNTPSASPQGSDPSNSMFKCKILKSNIIPSSIEPAKAKEYLDKANEIDQGDDKCDCYKDVASMVFPDDIKSMDQIDELLNLIQETEKGSTKNNILVDRAVSISRAKAMDSNFKYLNAMLSQYLEEAITEKLEYSDNKLVGVKRNAESEFLFLMGQMSNLQTGSKNISNLDKPAYKLLAAKLYAKVRESEQYLKMARSLYQSISQQYDVSKELFQVICDLRVLVPTRELIDNHLNFVLEYNLSREEQVRRLKVFIDLLRAIVKKTDLITENQKIEISNNYRHRINIEDGSEWGALVSAILLEDVNKEKSREDYFKFIKKASWKNDSPDARNLVSEITTIRMDEIGKAYLALARLTKKEATTDVVNVKDENDYNVEYFFHPGAFPYIGNAGYRMSPDLIEKLFNIENGQNLNTFKALSKNYKYDSIESKDRTATGSTIDRFSYPIKLVYDSNFSEGLIEERYNEVEDKLINKHGESYYYTLSGHAWIYWSKRMSYVRDLAVNQSGTELPVIMGYESSEKFIESSSTGFMQEYNSLISMSGNIRVLETTGIIRIKPGIYDLSDFDTEISAKEVILEDGAVLFTNGKNITINAKVTGGLIITSPRSIPEKAAYDAGSNGTVIGCFYKKNSYHVQLGGYYGTNTLWCAPSRIDNNDFSKCHDVIDDLEIWMNGCSSIHKASLNKNEIGNSDWGDYTGHVTLRRCYSESRNAPSSKNGLNGFSAGDVKIDSSKNLSIIMSGGIGGSGSDGAPALGAPQYYIHGKKDSNKVLFDLAQQLSFSYKSHGASGSGNGGQGGSVGKISISGTSMTFAFPGLGGKPGQSSGAGVGNFGESGI